MTETKKKTQYWLMKSEPSCYSIDDLRKQRVGMWDGVRNYQARNMMRDDMCVGDVVLFYHSSEAPIGIVGEAAVAKAGYPDPTQFDPKADHYDPTAQKENPRWYVVDVRFVSKYPRILTLAEIKNDPVLKDMVVAQRGSRLSVQPVTKKQYERIVSLMKG
jgi:predicted RNA-binding protein with PUA-like domain